jgi:hypothetical protein
MADETVASQVVAIPRLKPQNGEHMAFGEARILVDNGSLARQPDGSTNIPSVTFSAQEVKRGILIFLPPLPDLVVYAAEKAATVSLAAGIHHIPGFQGGTGRFIADALGGNVGSGAVDLYQSFATGKNGSYNIAQAAVAKGAPSAAESGAGITDVTEEVLLGAGLASGAAELKLIYDDLTFAGASHCLNYL